MDNRAHGQWGTGVWGTWAIVYRGMEYRGYRLHGQWGTWPMGAQEVMITGDIAYRGYGSHGLPPQL